MLCNITKNDIEILHDSNLRNLIGRLCIAELEAAGDMASRVTFGGDQDAADGGVDVRVERKTIPTPGSFVPCEKTVFQVKKQIMNASAIRSEMMPNGVLRDCIRDLVRSGGAYIIVSSVDNCTDAMLARRIAAMRKCVAGITDGSVLQLNFYDVSRIANWVNCYPSEALWVCEHITKSVARNGDLAINGAPTQN